MLTSVILLVVVVKLTGVFKVLVTYLHIYSILKMASK